MPNGDVYGRLGTLEVAQGRQEERLDALTASLAVRDKNQADLFALHRTHVEDVVSGLRKWIGYGGGSVGLAVITDIVLGLIRH